MSASRSKTKPSDRDPTQTPDKKRSLAESRAAAKEYKDSLKRKSTSNIPSPKAATTHSSSKKPRRQLKSSKEEKVEARKLSRERAQQYAQKLSASRQIGAGESASPKYRTAEGTSESDIGVDFDSDGMDTTSDVDAAGQVEPLPKRKIRPTSVAAPLPRHESPLLPPTPPMPDVFPGQPHSVAMVRPSPESYAYPTPSRRMASTGGYTAGYVAGQPSDLSSRPSFLRSAEKKDGVAAADTGLTGPRRSSLKSPPSVGYGDQFVVRQPESRTRRESFLTRATANGSAIPTKALESTAENPGKQDTQTEEVKEADKATVIAVTSGASSSSSSPRKERAKVWACTCAVALAPLILSCLVWGVLVPAWPNVRLSAGGAWSAISGLGANSPHKQKCFLESNQDSSICKAGTEVAACPSPAVCGLGRILSCDIPFEKAKDGTGCVLSAAAEKEADVVVAALRTLTIEQQCKGRGLIMPSSSPCRSVIKLTDAAIALDRKPLYFLASMPAGNVAGLVDLEGEPALAFGGGEGGAEGAVGSGSERVARLSEAMANTVTLPWGCRARVFAGVVVLEHWKIILGLWALGMAVLYLDVKRLTNYRRHVQVCAMRDDSYKALLDHSAKDSSPMQMSHIQDFVGDRWRAKGQGSTATIQKNVRKLWHLVENEVAHDSRIRRNFKNVRGQHNVVCWQWMGPSSTRFESCGALDPGPAPRLWLLWCFNKRMPKR